MLTSTHQHHNSSATNLTLPALYHINHTLKKTTLVSMILVSNSKLFVRELREICNYKLQNTHFFIPNITSDKSLCVDLFSFIMTNDC